jgi:hypothetical protein
MPLRSSFTSGEKEPKIVTPYSDKPTNDISEFTLRRPDAGNSTNWWQHFLFAAIIPGILSLFLGGHALNFVRPER